MWFRALLAIAPAVLFLATPAPVVHADGACTPFGNDSEAYNACLDKLGIRCKSTGGVIYIQNVTCPYPDGGRDECVIHIAPFSQGRQIDSASCTYIPPGPAPATAPAEPS